MIDYFKKERTNSINNIFSLQNLKIINNSSNIHNNTIKKKLEKNKKIKKIENRSNIDLEDITYTAFNNKLTLNEQVFCFCNYISHGSMIKCDNSKVF
jgi:hypothetical protein